MTESTATFEQACQDAVNHLRAAFVELYDSVDADPLSPQDVARRFKLNKTLTWNVSRLIQAADGLAAVTHVPGRAAIEKMLAATQKDGASQKAVSGVRSATDEFERVVEIHLGDRTTLDLVLDGISTPSNDGLERSRKLAFRGNSGLYGVQAKARLTTSFLGPNADDPDRLDMAQVVGYSGFRRLRGAARWPVFTPRGWASDEEEPITEHRWQPITTASNGTTDAAIMTEYSRGSLPEMEAVQTSDGLDIMLKPGPIGNPGAFDCYRGEFMRSAASRFSTDGDDVGEFGSAITTPVEFLVADLIVHEDLLFALDAEVLVFARIFPHGEHGLAGDHLELPIRQKLAQLPGRPPAVATALVPQYADVVRAVYDRLGWDPTRFRGVRLQMAYPPFGSTVLLRFKLPAK